MRAGAPVSAAALAGAAAILALVTAPAALATQAARAGRPAHGRHAQAGQASTDGQAGADGQAGKSGQGGRSGQRSQSRQASQAGQLSRAARLAIGGTDLASRGLLVNYPAPGARRLPRVPASAYVIADASTGQVLAAKDPHGEFAPASTLKVLTAITLISRLTPDTMVLATRRAADTEPNDVGVVPGRRYTASSLFTALLTISANDAAVALTQAAGGGSLARGMALINAEAHHLQAYDVVARQPNGLPAAGQVVSAYDEALIARQALASPAFMHYDGTRAARFRVKPKHWVTLVNQNYLLTQYRGGIGGKIGWTVKSKATYIGLARRNGVTLIVTVLHCTPLAEITSGERLLNWGFAMDGKVHPVGTLVQPLPAVTVAKKTTAQQARARALRLASQADAQSSDLLDAGLAVGAAVVAVGVFALGSLARRRRQAVAAGRHRPG
jgi:D-alanyl-D-alanine carboxypeptidase (penicillin-binding protein 5/6)